jgi:hypothetical protein
VDISFDRAYDQQPIVNVNITLNATTATSTLISQEDLAVSLFENDIRYVVINKRETGFTIILNKNALEEITFSWTALAVKNAKTFSLIEPASEVLPPQSPNPASIEPAVETIQPPAATTPPILEVPGENPETVEPPAVGIAAPPQEPPVALPKQPDPDAGASFATQPAEGDAIILIIPEPLNP